MATDHEIEAVKPGRKRGRAYAEKYPDNYRRVLDLGVEICESCGVLYGLHGHNCELIGD
jgi:hypothetical protein